MTRPVNITKYTKEIYKIIDDQLNAELQTRQALNSGAMQDNPNALEVLCKCVAEGGSMLQFVEKFDLDYSLMVNWVRKDKDRLKAFNEAMNSRVNWAIERVLNELKFIGMVDIRKIYDDKGNLKPVSDWPDDVARAVSGIETEELFEGRGDEREMIGISKKVKLNDKIRALELIGKNLAMFIERHQIEVVATPEDLVLASYKVQEAKDAAEKMRAQQAKDVTATEPVIEIGRNESESEDVGSTGVDEREVHPDDEPEPERWTEQAVRPHVRADVHRAEAERIAAALVQPTKHNK